MRLGIILLLLNMVFLKQAYAITSTDSTKNTPNNSFNTIGGNCNYYGQDTYNGTELPAAGMSSPYFGTGPSWTTPPLVDSGGMTLAWSGGSSSSLAVPVTCSGKYQVIFTLELQATDSSNTIAVYPCVKTTDNVTTIYGNCPPTLGSAISFTFNPACNGGNYCGTQTFNFATQATLTAGQTVAPPSLIANGKLAVTGGQFIAYYYGP